MKSAPTNNHEFIDEFDKVEKQMNQHDFVAQERASRDTIDVKRSYILMAGDIASGVLLSQIVFWHLPDKEGNQTKLTVKRNNHLWLAKKRDDWWDEICMLPKQFDRAIKDLEIRQLVKTELFRFGGSPVKHIRLNWDVFLPVYEAMINDDAPSFDPEGGKWNFPDRENPISLKGKMEIDQQGISETPREPTPVVAPSLVENGHRLHTENTAENTTDIDFFSKNPGQNKKCQNEVENSTNSPNRSVVGVAARKRLKGKKLEAFETVADNFRKVGVKDLEFWCNQNPERVLAAYREVVRLKGIENIGDVHYNYWKTIHANWNQSEKPGTRADYSKIDKELYGGVYEDE